MQNADIYESYVFQEEAKKIDEIYNKYIKIVKEEKPYDVFICYKDKMENGEPTEDSMIAYNIYNSLEQAGYRTFFAKKSLESKLGQEYEPYIYAALMSATVMIVLGTKTEYYNSTWVKNEWSRFLELKKENKNKTLIACFKNMSPYEMPMEFSAFQSFDLNKIGYVEYLVEGVNHVIQNSKRKNGILPNEETSEVNRLAANAETFARGAVRLLTESGIVDTLAFGSENGNLQELQEAAKILANETEEFQRLLKELLSKGLSYPAARAKVLETLSQINSAILSKPNDILGLEYLKALDYYSSPIAPLTIRRKGDYNSLSLSSGYASASAVRKALTEENSTEAMLHLPENTHDLYNKALSIGTAPVFWDTLMPALHYKLRTTSIEELKEIAEVTEGLENRILHSIDSCYSFEDMMDFIKTKRYTRTKIQRILLHILLDIKESEVSYFLNLPKMPYVRVLGFQKDHSDILADLTEQAKCPVLTNLKKAPALLNEDGLAMLALEKTATDLHALAYPNPIYRAPNQDFTKPLVIL